MRAYAGILLIILISLVITGTAGAVGIPDKVTVATSKPWITANNIDTSTISVTVENTTPGYSGKVGGVTVALNVDTAYGTLTSTSLTTDATGAASTTFKVKTKSGAPVITATVPGFTPVPSGTVTQNIDHDTPYYSAATSPPLFTYPSSGEAGSEISFKVSLYDRWGNKIDNLNPAGSHAVTLYVESTMVPDDCAIKNDTVYAKTVTHALGADGTLTIPVRLTTKTGTNYISMASIGDIGFKTVAVTVVATGIPVRIEGWISDGGILPANNIDKFTVDYYLYDLYGNRMANRGIWINTNLTDETTKTLHTSDANGLIRFYYGPKMSVLTSEISAEAADNATLKNTMIAQFVAEEATNMVLSVSPQIMASREVKPSSSAYVRATVVDQFGNPVEGETVTFTLGSVSGYGFANLTPSLSSATATTNIDGNAIIIFYPGSFPLFGETNFNSGASAEVPITATWESVTRSVTATWKNYPYINIETSVDPTTVKVNETIDVTIDLTGDGYSLAGGDVAAIMDLDSSSSIWSNKDVPGPKRIDSAKAAAKAFANEMLLPAGSGNWIGVNSFGNEKKDNDRLLSPQTDIDIVTDKIDLLVKGTNSQEFGNSVMDSINNLTETQKDRPTDKVRAVIALKDSGGGNLDNNQYPTKEDLIALSQSTSPKTMIFTVYYYDGVSDSSSTQVILEDLAAGTGGQFFRAESSSELIEAFKKIAEILKTAAGVNTTLTLNFQNVEVNGTAMPGDEAFTYIPVGTPYTLSTTAMARDDIDGRTRIMWQNSTHSVWDQSADWIANQQLSFNVGTVNVSDRWNATYRLKTNKVGLINIFNCSLSPSQLFFDDGGTAQSICLPDLYIMVNENTTPLGVSTGELDISDLTPDSGDVTDTVPLQWNLKYNGTETVTETYYYSYNGQPYVPFGQVTGIPPTGDTPIARSRNLDISMFPAGPYTVKIVASVAGIPPDEEIGGFAIPVAGKAVNIELR